MTNSMSKDNIMKNNVIKNGYIVDTQIFDLVNGDILPGLSINAEQFWNSTADILDEFIPRNKALLVVRQDFQQQIDQWHQDPLNQPFDGEKYQSFLLAMGYLEQPVDDFVISTENVDDEVALIAGPQLVVPLMNARFALNAANARWGSLYDALYGTDVISELDGGEKSAKYNPIRGLRVQQFAKDFLDQSIPLAVGSHHDSKRYYINQQQLVIELASGELTQLIVQECFKGFVGNEAGPEKILCCHAGLHIEIQIDRKDPIGKTDQAGIKDVYLESALTTIQDCEDSIAAVDAADKVIVYRNWLGLMKGDLTDSFDKNGKAIVRKLNRERKYLSPDKLSFSLPSTSIQFIRNVGHLMTTDAILTASNDEVPEGIIDAIITSLIGLHDLQSAKKMKNSAKGCIYIVKPKMHGSEEVVFTDDLFSAVERCLKLPQYTIKMGIMDEERRTSLNLKACIKAAKHRVAFINTGFLDRTGDEIHTSMLAGPMVEKDRMKELAWIDCYESQNVKIGLQTGFQGKAQIGKGMWAMPDLMLAMLAEKIGHPMAGANCAWVPSPTAATLHVLHYHQVNVFDIQNKIKQENYSFENDRRALLSIPLLDNPAELSTQAIQNELDNNVQGLLGYVVRWIDQGIGCSKVPDINNVGRMEDRATLRIASQHICNWLHHQIINREQVIESLERMAKVVDGQNSKDKNYQLMSNNFDSNVAFNAAKNLIFEGEFQPSGYTEPLLHKSRQRIKQTILNRK